MRMILFLYCIFLTAIVSPLHAQEAFTLAFHPFFQGEPLANDRFYVTEKGDSIKPETFKIYLSGFEVKGENPGFYYKETESYHLLDLENPASFQFPLRGIPEGLQSGVLHFQLGIDSLTNVSGAMGGALDPSKGMYWTWQSGYINLKLEGISPSNKTRNHEFQFHLGGYLSPFNAVQSVDLPFSGQKTLDVGIDLSVFFRNIELKTQKSIMSPCKDAVYLSGEAAKMFYILNP